MAHMQQQQPGPPGMQQPNADMMQPQLVTLPTMQGQLYQAEQQQQQQTADN